MKNIKKEGDSFTLKDVRAVIIVAAYAAAFLIGAIAPFIAHAAGGYSISGSSSVSGTTVTLSGTASANTYVGKSSDQNIAVDWTGGCSSAHATTFTFDSITFTGGTGPDHNNGSFTNASWHTSHDFGAAGTYSVCVKVYHANFNGNEGSDAATFSTSIVVPPTNHAPVANDDTFNKDKDTPLSVSAPGVIDNDTDDDSDSLTATLVNGPSHASSFTLNADGSFDYTPESGYSGVDQFTYTVSDGSATSNTANVYINVSHVNHAPVAVTDTYSVNQGDTLTVNAPGVLTNDSDADGDTLTAELESDVNDGTLTLNPDGSFMYIPDPSFSGLDTFTYKASDGSLFSSTETVEITVNHVNHAPVANGSTITTDSNTAANGSVSATDADGDTLKYSVDTSTTNGMLTLNSDGTYTYTPNAGYVGSDSFTFKANDGTADSNTATVDITVNAVPVPTPTPTPTPSPSPTPPPSGGNGPIAGTLGNGGGNGPIAGSLSNGPIVGQVLGASTTTLPELPAGCSALLHTYMRMGRHNDSAEVKLLQQFLNDQLGTNLAINGIFGESTDAAVRKFQKTHEPQILTPWGIDYATGYVYKTTQRWINLTECSSLDIPMPELN